MAASRSPASLWRSLLALAALVCAANLALFMTATTSVETRSRGPADDAPRDAPATERRPRGAAPGVPPAASGTDGVESVDDGASGSRDLPGGRGGTPSPQMTARGPPTVCLSDAGTTTACGTGRRDPGPDASYSLPAAPEEDDEEVVTRSGRSRRGDRAKAPPDDGCVTAAGYQERGPPSTCNDVHGLAFVGSDLYDVTYLTSGGYRSVYVVDFLGGEEEVRSAIVKTHRDGRDFRERDLRKNQLDVLILGEAGGPGGLDGDDGDRGGGGGVGRGTNVLSVWQYCAYTSVSPYATSGTLSDYVKERGDGLSPDEMYDLSLQAARGVAGMHLHRPDGVATFAHADVKPPQFLLFDRGDGRTPAVMINDFNRGRLLGYDPGRGRACPFRLCGIKHNGSTYRSPEEYMDCADQDDRIDVYSLGGIIYFIVTGRRPWHYRSFGSATRRILDGETSLWPGDEGYGGEDDDGGGGRHGGGRDRGGRRERRPDGGGPDGRTDHPAVRTLREVASRCWAYRPEDRPSSLEVVRMLEDGLGGLR